MTLGEHLRDLRRARSLDAQQLADAAGIGRSMLSRYEHGRVSPRPSTVSKLLAAMNEVLPLTSGERRAVLAAAKAAGERPPARAASTPEASDTERAELLARWSEALAEVVGIDQVLELMYVAGGLAGVPLPARRFLDELRPGDRIVWRPSGGDEVFVVCDADDDDDEPPYRR